MTIGTIKIYSQPFTVLQQFPWPGKWHTWQTLWNWWPERHWQALMTEGWCLRIKLYRTCIWSSCFLNLALAESNKNLLSGLVSVKCLWGWQQLQINNYTIQWLVKTTFTLHVSDITSKFWTITMLYFIQYIPVGMYMICVLNCGCLAAMVHLLSL